jgi:hypothetical protein
LTSKTPHGRSKKAAPEEQDPTQLTAGNVEVQRLKAQIKVLESDITISKDLGKSLEVTRQQLALSEQDRSMLQDKLKTLAEDFERQATKSSAYL